MYIKLKLLATFDNNIIDSGQIPVIRPHWRNTGAVSPQQKGTHIICQYIFYFPFYHFIVNQHILACKSLSGVSLSLKKQLSRIKTLAGADMTAAECDENGSCPHPLNQGEATQNQNRKFRKIQNHSYKSCYRVFRHAESKYWAQLTSFIGILATFFPNSQPLFAGFPQNANFFLGKTRP